MSMHTRISVDQTLHGTASLQIHPGLPRIQRIDEFDAAKEGSRELAAHNIGAKERGALLLLLWMQVLSKLLGAQKLSDAIGNITCRIDDEERSAAPLQQLPAPRKLGRAPSPQPRSSCGPSRRSCGNAKRCK